MDVVNNEEARIGEQKQQHQGLLVRLLGKDLRHAALENMDLSSQTAHLRALLCSESEDEVCDDHRESLEEDRDIRGVVEVPDIQHGGVNEAAVRTLQDHHP